MKPRLMGSNRDVASSIPQQAKEVANADRVRRARGFVGAFVRTYQDNDLLTRASAISFQTLFALVPAALAGVALLGFFGLEEYWTNELSPTVEEEVGEEAFGLIDNAVQQVLTTQQFFWVTAGVAFALWQVSGAMRANGGGLDRIYGASGERPFVRRIAYSVILAAGVALIFGVAALALFAGPEILQAVGLGVPAFIAVPLVRYIVPAALVLLVMGLVVRFSTSSPPPYRFIGLTSVVTVAAWIIATLVFRWYATEIAEYESVFGGLASIIVLMTYFYISANVFLGGFQLDAMVRGRREDRDGRRGDEREKGP
jgi:membrane protein